MPDIELVDGVPSFTVSQFAGVLNRVLSQSFDDGVWVEGEIQGYRAPRPHLYFSLVEVVNGKTSKLDIKIFAGMLAPIQKKLRNAGLELKDGMKVRVRGNPDFYAPFGTLGLKTFDIDTKFTIGDIAEQRAALIQKLKDTGVTKMNKRRPVPVVPLRLGIVSSSQAAGFADARKHLMESGIAFSITLCDVRVQGDEAVPMIVGAIQALSRRDDIDLVLVMRGGGSKNDLAAFDDERIVMAIARCRHPVFTGIGHQVDQSIADIVAHTECKTPTACADAVIEIVNDFLHDLNSTAAHVRSATLTAVEKARGKMRLNRERLVTRARTALERQGQRVALHAATVRGLDPVVTMARGWSITRSADGRVVRSAADVAKGDTITTLVADGAITSTVEGTDR